ncbi:MAG TPA: 50S ribosomal protein L32 [Lentisphaerae bacterium]|nr:MAG: 50S ribosomal protein L32 [Verrucomicrobiota bacterium]HDL77715.1 50S ribosomal protein L32 [Lentisphaerota bacterium]
MGVPKRRKSRMKVRQRRNQIRRSIARPVPCPQCGAPRLPHRVCPECGYYGGRQVLTLKEKTKEKSSR